MTDLVGPMHEVRRGAGRGWAVVAVVAVVAAAAGGFAAGRASAGSDRDDVRAGPASAATDDGGTAEELGVSGSGDLPILPQGGIWGSDDALQPVQLDEVLLRAAPGGVEVRLYRSGQPGGVPSDLELYGGAAVCDPEQWLVVELSNRGAVHIEHVQTFHATSPATLAGAGTFGVAEGDPAWWAVVWAGPDVAEVRGGGDQAAPVAGWAVLGGAGVLPTAEVEAVDAGGAVLAAFALEPWPEACIWPGQGPPAMPEPGEQPADPAVAEAEVRQAYVDAWDHTVDDRDVKAAAIEGAEELEQAREEAVANFPDAAATISVEVREVVFTDPETAAVRFELFYEAGAQFGEQIGHARFVDGRWKVARTTTCRVLGWAGASC